MSDCIIERTDKFRLVSHGGRAAFTFDNLKTGQSHFVQYGDDALGFDAEYTAMQEAYANPQSVWHTKPWDSCLAELWASLGYE